MATKTSKQKTAPNMQQKQGTTGGGSQDKKGTTGGDGREKTKTQDVGKTGREKTSRAVTTSDSKRATEEGGQKQFDFEEDDGTCSMVIECRDKKQLYCHKDFLSIWSPVFKEKCSPPAESEDNKGKDEDGLQRRVEETVTNRLEEEEQESRQQLSYTADGLLELELDEDPGDMKLLLTHLYQPNIPITDDNVEQLAALSHVYDIEPLRAKSEDYLIDHGHRGSNAELMLLAENYEMERLREHLCKQESTRQLLVIEADEHFEELNEESRMMMWRERALYLEAQQPHIDEVAEKQYALLKFIAKKHKCKVIPEDKFTTVTQFTKDARGRKVKETIENATMVKLGECDENCRVCCKYLGKNCMENIGALDRLEAFQSAKRADEVHTHFHPKH
ncbi:uncharacterized protein LOC134840156 isoform X2 [Symsagittifera roscoffensis]|uniref:uncharacterized protein LOC134840156 isoform X2 n=1 Tax=Symsagittifera roscoffensis TaxID=84072 RepID=UPI00307C3972